MQEHEAHGSSETEITTGGTHQLKALVGLIGSDAFAMSFQSVRQYREALLNAAPAVQGEPVAWMVTSIRPDFDKPIKALHSVQMLADEQQRHWEGRGCLVYQTPLYTAPQPAEQQPTPDVPGLAEALEARRDDLRWMSLRHNYHNQTVEEADAALASYHKQGGDL